MPPTRSKMASDSDMASTLGTLKKWLKAQNINSSLNISGHNVSEGLRHGILFLDYLRASRHYPSKLTDEELSLLKVIEELSSQVDHTAAGATAGISKPAPSSKRKKENKENILPGKPKVAKKIDKGDINKDMSQPGPKSKKKLAPFSSAASQTHEPKGCSCKGDCKTKVCGCRKKDQSCHSTCKCSDSCINKTEPVEQSEKEDMETAKIANTGKVGRTDKAVNGAMAAKGHFNETFSDNEEISDGDESDADGRGDEEIGDEEIGNDEIGDDEGGHDHGES